MEQIGSLIAAHQGQFWAMAGAFALTFLWVLVNEVGDDIEKQSEAERREEIEGYWIWMGIAAVTVFVISVFKTGYYVLSETDLISMIGATLVVVGGAATLAVLFAAALAWGTAQILILFGRGVALFFQGMRAVVLFIRDDLGVGRVWRTTTGWIRRFRDRSQELMRNKSHG